MKLAEFLAKASLLSTSDDKVFHQYLSYAVRDFNRLEAVTKVKSGLLGRAFDLPRTELHDKDFLAAVEEIAPLQGPGYLALKADREGTKLFISNVLTPMQTELEVAMVRNTYRVMGCISSEMSRG